MKILIILLAFLIQPMCFASSNIKFYNHGRPFYNRGLFNRGTVTGIPYPIYQYNPVLIQEQPTYVKRKHIKKKYRKYYPQDTENSYILIEN